MSQRHYLPLLGAVGKHHGKLSIIRVAHSVLVSRVLLLKPQIYRQSQTKVLFKEEKQILVVVY